MINTSSIKTERFHFYRAAGMPADLAIDLASRFAQSLTGVRVAESKMDTIGLQDEREAQWAKDWASKGQSEETEDAKIAGLARVEVEEIAA